MAGARAALYMSGRAALVASAAVTGCVRGAAPLVLVNPGPTAPLARALLTPNLASPTRAPRLILFEQAAMHEPQLQQLKEQYPDELNYYIADFFGMWKLAFQDKMDNGSRIETLLKDIKPHPWGEDISMNVIGTIPSLNFVKHLITSIIFQNSIILAGRPEFYLSMLPLDYYTLVTDSSSKMKFHYRPTPVLFNILFDQKLLAKLPREDFSPPEIISSIIVKNKTKIKLANIDKDYLYLVQITPKVKLPCRAEHLPLLWYFFKHHLISKGNRIIPMLEQWIPGCGVWLITGQDPPGTNVEIGPDENNASLPHITIFTQFSDLNPQQKLTLFKKFISWPEFEQSPFKETLENHIYKSFSHSDHDIKIDNIESEEEIKERVEST